MRFGGFWSYPDNLLRANPSHGNGKGNQYSLEKNRPLSHIPILLRRGNKSGQYCLKLGDNIQCKEFQNQKFLAVLCLFIKDLLTKQIAFWMKYLNSIYLSIANNPVLLFLNGKLIKIGVLEKLKRLINLKDFIYILQSSYLRKFVRHWLSYSKHIGSDCYIWWWSSGSGLLFNLARHI